MEDTRDQQDNNDHDEEREIFYEVELAMRDEGERFVCIVQRLLLTPRE